MRFDDAPRLVEVTHRSAHLALLNEAGAMEPGTLRKMADADRR